MKTIDKLYALFLRAANSLQSPLLLAVRLYWGCWFLQAGWGKLTNIARTTEYFTSLGIPQPELNARFVGLIEGGGGLLLILGLASRLIAIPLVINMLVAFITAEREALQLIFSPTDSEKFYSAAPFTFLFAALLVLVFGPGWFSIDTLIAEFRKGDWAATGKIKIFSLVYVLCLIVYIVAYNAAHGSVGTMGDITKWWNLLVALLLFGLAYIVTSALTKKRATGTSM